MDFMEFSHFLGAHQGASLAGLVGSSTPPQHVSADADSPAAVNADSAKLYFFRGVSCRICGGTTMTGWWFGTFFIFPYIGNNHPNWLIFFRGVQTTNQWILMWEKPVWQISDFDKTIQGPVAVSRSEALVTWFCPILRWVHKSSTQRPFQKLDIADSLIRRVVW